MDAKDRIIVALDVDNLDEASSLVKTLSPYVGCFKVGLELITSVGAPHVVKSIQALGGQVFFDGKFKDIPNTVAKASAAVTRLGVKMFNVHCSGGVPMMLAAHDAAEAEWIEAEKLKVFRGQEPFQTNFPLLLGVTVLTSLEENESHLIYGFSSKAKVLQFARDAKLAGLEGIICSPQELELLGKQKELGNFLKVTPGIRPTWAATGDQKRFTTPSQALEAGADYVVIGRPITNPPAKIGSPVDAVKEIIGEISSIK